MVASRFPLNPFTGWSIDPQTGFVPLYLLSILQCSNHNKPLEVVKKKRGELFFYGSLTGMNKPMATRAVSSFSIVRSAAYPPFCIILSRHFFRFRFPSPSPTLKLSHSQTYPSNSLSPQFYGGQSTSHAHSLVDYVMEELKAMRSMRRVRATKRKVLTSSKKLLFILWMFSSFVLINCRVVLASTAEELLEVKPAKRSLQKGSLLEFRRDTQKLLLAIAQKPDGKTNWIVCNQNGVISSIKPQQITYIVAVFENFCHRDIPDFIQKAQSLLDPTILECAREELLENKRSVTAEELAEILYGSSEPLESYCAHILLSENDIYFNQVESKGYLSIYEPRPTVQDC